MTKMVCPLKNAEINIPEDCGGCSYLRYSSYNEAGICTYGETSIPPMCVIGVTKSVGLLKKAYLRIRRRRNKGIE